MYNFIYVVILFFGTFGFILIFWLDFGDFNTKQEQLFAIERAYTHSYARRIAHIAG
jgi:quinol-cytochrome oxidoreductase complex cytochrome b subunit